MFLVEEFVALLQKVIQTLSILWYNHLWHVGSKGSREDTKSIREVYRYLLQLTSHFVVQSWSQVILETQTLPINHSTGRLANLRYPASYLSLPLSVLNSSLYFKGLFVLYVSKLFHWPTVFTQLIIPYETAQDLKCLHCIKDYICRIPGGPLNALLWRIIGDQNYLILCLYEDSKIHQEHYGPNKILWREIRTKSSHVKTIIWKNVANK